MRRVAALLIAFMAFFTVGFATARAEVPGSSGTDFAFSCLPGMHATSDSIFIVLSSAHVASGSIDYTSANGVPVQRFFSVSDPRRATYIAIPRTDLELQGVYRDSLRPLNVQTEKVLSQQVVRIHSDSVMSVAVLMNGSAGSSAFSLYPTAISGSSYVISTSASGVAADASMSVDAQRSRPAQFVVIATADATQVTIDLRAKTADGTSGQRTVLLNANQAYFVQAALDTSVSMSDLSGTQIRSTAPIVVLCGHQAAQLPSLGGFRNENAREGGYCVQLTSVDRWGTDFVLVPTTTTEAALTSGAEYARVFAVTDNTVLSIDGVNKDPLKAGDFLDLTIRDAHLLHSSAAVSVYQFAVNNSAENVQLGNATMFPVTSMQQWSNEHTVCALQTRVGTAKTFASQYIIVIAPTEAMSTVLYDGEPALNTVYPVANTRYSYMIRRIADGIHSLTCDSACGVYVYGFSSDRRYVMSSDLDFPQRAFLRPVFSIPDCSADIGDTVTVRVHLDSLILPPKILGLQPASFSFDLCVNSTVLTPADASARGPIRNGRQVIAFHDTLSTLTESVTLASMPMICGLGDAEESRIEIDNLHWFTATGDTIQLDFKPVFGTFRVKDVWKDHDGPRLFNPQPGDLKLDVTPNPVHGRAFITCSSELPMSIAPSLILYNAMGEVVADLSSEIRSFSHIVQFTYNMQELGSGVYYLRFGVADKSVVITVVNE